MKAKRNKSCREMPDLCWLCGFCGKHHETKLEAKNCCKKTIKQELIENYSKGSDKEYEIISCGVDEMVRFIKRILRRKN